MSALRESSHEQNVAAATNLSIGRPSTQSSTSPWSAAETPEADAAFANDGVIDHPGREFANHTNFEGDPWWQVDLGADHVIERVKIFNRRTYPERLRFFSILVSRDGETWRSVYRKTDNSVFGPDGEGAYVAEIDTPHLARWVRVRVEGYQVFAVRQCEVFGRTPTIAEFGAARAAEAQHDADVAEFARGRTGRIVPVATFGVFADEERYSEAILGSFGRNDYEGQEREILREVLRPDDRVFEIGTAVGVISMTAAAVTGAAAVSTFEANPYIHADARRNFAFNGMGAIRSGNAILKNRASWGGSAETMRFCISRDFWSSRIDASASSEDIVEVIDVPTGCLEEQIEAHGATFMICDIEGGEIDLLLEADLSSLSAILLETHPWAVGRAATAALIRKLITDGFDLEFEHCRGDVLFFRAGEAMRRSG